MVQEPRWDGFGVRLGRAIDRWSGGGQRAFAEQLAKHAEKNGITIPSSYRTLLNYLSETTRPSVAWVEAAAAVLRWNPEHLLTGEGAEREGGDLDGLTFTPQRGVQERTSFLVHYLNRHHTDTPIGARWMILRFLGDYFGDDLEGWPIPDSARAGQVTDVLGTYYGPLLARPKMRYHETMTLAASLTAAAYTVLGNEPHDDGADR